MLFTASPPRRVPLPSPFPPTHTCVPVLQEYNDTLLTLYLASMTRGTHLANEVVDKFGLAYEKASRRRGGAGGMAP